MPSRIWVYLSVYAALILFGLSARLSYAETSDASTLSFVAPHLCLDREELAGVTNAEAGAQAYSVQIGIMQIFVAESEQRGISFCALSHLTNFSSVRSYVRLHPASYLARQLAYPSPELLQMADAVLRHELLDATMGMRHFNGSANGMTIVFTP